MSAASDTEKLAAAVRRGDRRALARAITLAESTHSEDRAAAEALLAQILPGAGTALRIGISGAPGAGKSTFIDAYGRVLTAAGKRVAVLAIDPSSKRGGGALLGDKTRMPELAKDSRAFIRPSPAGQSLGGVARRTREAVLITEAAGFDRVIVETVGVGQSESDVADMVDLFLVLVAPGGGDELQGMKRGNLELADFVVVTKCDGDLEAAARRAASDYAHALHLLRGAADTSVVAVSALAGRGIDALAAEIEQRAEALAAAGAISARRARQAGAALWREIGEGLTEAFRADSRVAPLLRSLEAEVASGRLTPAAAAAQALAAFLT
ncbi:MAG TPA: methylmalonyl Co-A mutase-associated GTPase MeaB [Stellaceae bacterium]|nr:methylmalonyl Co-A mutase-associated GTPase MeaB [Stellaceae bacterium]